MPKGPFGLRRVTNLGPFASENTKAVVTREEERQGALPPELERLIEKTNWDVRSWRRWSIEITVRNVYEDEASDPVEQIRREVASLGERVASTYYILLDNGAGYTVSTKVDRRIRKEGVGSQLKEETHKHLRELNADRIYSYPSTSGGERLLRSNDYTESEFDGFMVKRLD